MFTAVETDLHGLRHLDLLIHHHVKRRPSPSPAPLPGVALAEPRISRGGVSAPESSSVLNAYHGVSWTEEPAPSPCRAQLSLWASLSLS